MENPPNQQSQPLQPPQPELFPSKVEVLCSWNECTKGHSWRPTIALANCQGCNSTSLMVKKENCPYCNEPTIKLTLRSDHLPKGAGVSQRCKGEKIYGETLSIELERTKWKELENEIPKIPEN